MRLLKSQAFIDGEWLDANSGEDFAVVNPATGEIIARAPDMASEDVRFAVERANAAFQSWKSFSAYERAETLRRWCDTILANMDDLAVLLTQEQGKPLAEAKAEISYGVSYIDWFAEEAKRIYGDTIPAPSTGQRISVIKEPVGVCAAITPWNFPVAMIARKAGAALAAGCTMIVKPAEQTPLSALALATLANEAQIPNGVFNVITSSRGDRIGDEFCSNPLVRKLSFTGSTEVGRLLLSQCAHTVKKVSLELGGNAPFIVFDDADLGKAVVGAMASKFRNSGQTCVCANRFYIHEAIHDQFVEKLRLAVTALNVGDGLDGDVQQGPLIDQKAVQKVEILIRDAIEAGAKLIVGGDRHKLGGTFFEPTIITNVFDNMKVMKEEIFGPIAAISTFADERDVITRANNTPYGLASYVFSENLNRITRVSDSLEYGMVGVNTGVISAAAAPFGGMKQSGIGREGSRYGIDDYLELKYLCLGGLQ